jgi:hypothetical protein
MSELIQSINDPHFRSLLRKLTEAGWLEKVIETPKTESTKANFEIIWTRDGQLCMAAMITGMIDNDFGDACAVFLRSLSEQEEAFFRDNFLDAFPRK